MNNKSYENINYNEGKITAIIAVRKGSVRCPNKNTKPFGSDTNLLTLKIKTLKKIKNIDEIIVTTNCEISKLIGNILGVTVLDRPEYYCSDNCSGSEMQEYIANQCKTEHILYSPVTSPFIDSSFLEKLIEKYRNLDGEKHDSIALKSRIKEFIFNKNIPVNYTIENFPRSQDLTKDIFYINFGCCILPKKIMIQRKYILGYSPLFLENKTNINSIDIDEPLDFNMGSLIYNKIYKKGKKITFIDVTIRDGGFVNNWNWKYDEVVNLYNFISEIGYEYFELGYFINDELKEKNSGIWRNLPIDILKNFPKTKCKISVMIDSWKYDIEKLKPQNLTNVDLIRVTSYKENIIYGINYCKKIKELGYKVSLNLIVISYYSNEELLKILKIILKEGQFLDYICIADSFGNMNHEKTKTIINYLLSYLNCLEIPIGFHIHENIGNGLQNAITSINSGIDILDTSFGGIGRGGGNLSMEDLLLYLNSITKIDNSLIIKVLDYCDKHHNNKKKLMQKLQGIYNIHPKSFDIVKCSTLKETYQKILTMNESEKYHYLNIR